MPSKTLIQIVTVRSTLACATSDASVSANLCSCSSVEMFKRGISGEEVAEKIQFTRLDGRAAHRDRAVRNRR